MGGREGYIEYDGRWYHDSVVFLSRMFFCEHEVKLYEKAYEDYKNRGRGEGDDERFFLYQLEHRMNV